MRKTIIGAALVASLLLAAPALASVTDSPTDAQYNPPNIPTEPAPPPQDTIGILPFTGNELIVLLLAGIALVGTGLLMRQGAVKQRRYDEAEVLREREEAGWSPRMDWNWPSRDR